MRIVGPSNPTAMYPLHVISQSRNRSRSENFRQGLSTFADTGAATVLTFTFYRLVEERSLPGFESKQPSWRTGI
jgi:hypothetical protein